MPFVTHIPCLALWAHLVAIAFILGGCGGGLFGGSSQCESGIQSYGGEQCFGTAPICGGSQSDCFSHHLTFVTTDNNCRGDESGCMSGNKAVCRSITSCCPGSGYNSGNGHSSPSCDLCGSGHFSTGGLNQCRQCAGCPDGQVRVGCSGGDPGECQNENCILFTATQACPPSATEPCAFTVERSYSQTSGQRTTVGGGVTVPASQLGSISATLQRQDYVETTTTDTHQSIIVMKPGATSCVFSRATLQSDGFTFCNQPEISANTLGRSGTQRQCPIAASNLAYNDAVCTNHNVCSSGQSSLMMLTDAQGVEAETGTDGVQREQGGVPRLLVGSSFLATGAISAAAFFFVKKRQTAQVEEGTELAALS